MELQDIEDEMTDDELRLLMLLAYARPCSTPRAEFNVSVTQEKFVRKSAEKGDCEDVELHYQVERKHNKSFMSCCIHRVEDHMFLSDMKRALCIAKELSFHLTSKH